MRWLNTLWLLAAACDAGGEYVVDPDWALVEDPAMVRGLMTITLLPKELRPDRLFAAGDASCPGVAFPLGEAPVEVDVACTSPQGMRYEGSARVASFGTLVDYDMAWREVEGSGAAALLPPQIPRGYARGTLDDGDRRDPPTGSTWAGDVASGVLDDLGIGEVRSLAWRFRKEPLGETEAHEVAATATLDAGAFAADLAYVCPVEVRPGFLCDEGTIALRVDAATVEADLTAMDPNTGCVQAVSGRGVEVALCL